MRLDKFISHALGYSRRDVKELIKNKKVKVNEKLVSKADNFIDPNLDIVSVNNKQIEYKEFVYIMLNKPKDVISATTDKIHKTVIDIVRCDYPNYDLFPMGRLDIDTEGLLILTNNGSLLHKVMSPKKDIYKKYYVEVEGCFSETDREVFLEGMELLDGKNEIYKSKKAYLEIISPTIKKERKTLGSYCSVKQIWENEKTNVGKAARLIAHLTEEQMDLTELEEVLIELFEEDVNVLQNKSNFKLFKLTL